MGDSIVVGAGVAPQQRWSALIAQHLGLTEINAGESGDVLQRDPNVQPESGCDRLLQPLETSSAGRYFMQFGLNDSNVAQFSPANFTNTYKEILSQLLRLGFATKDLVIVGPPYVRPSAWGSTPAPYNTGNDALLQQYNAAAKNAASSVNVVYIDAYAAMKNGGGDSLLQADGFHPNPQGHQAIANAVATAVA